MAEPFYKGLLLARDDDIFSGPGSGDPEGSTNGGDSLPIGAVVGIAAGGLVALCCVIFVCTACCVCFCVKYYRKRKRSNVIQNLPKFRVLDAPNPNFREDTGNELTIQQTSDHYTLAENIPLTESTQQRLSSPSRAHTITASEYSYANPDDFRLTTAAAVRGANAEEYVYARSVEAPGKSRAHSAPEPLPVQRIPSPYSEPTSVLGGRYGSVATSPVRSPVGSPPKDGIVESSPPAVESHYMTPATDEQTLYAQIKSLSVQQIKKNEIETHETLGKGNFGFVLKGEWNTPSGTRQVAIKTLKINTVQNIIKFLQEAAIMGQFHHPNIVELYGVVTIGEPIMIVLELMELGDLRDYLTGIRTDQLSTDPKLPILLLSFCRQIASGMRYLSSKSFVHRDLAARNIFLRRDLSCKIGDFGLARDLMDEEYYIARGGKIPIKWTAPEALSFRKYSSASDVWSYGVLMFEIWSLGRKPFHDQTNQNTLRMVEDGYRLPPPPGTPRAIYEIMINCWHPESSNRPTFDAIVTLLLGDETSLLQWCDKDRDVHLDAAVLGSDLAASEHLYTDLQLTYMT